MVTMMTLKWKREENELAKVIPKGNVSGFFKKEVILSPNEMAIIVREGEVQDIVNEGKLRVGGLLKPGNISKDVDVVLIDVSPKDIEFEQTGLWTADNQKINCHGLLRIKINEPKSFFQMLYAQTSIDKNSERTLSLNDVYSYVESEVLTMVLEPEVRKENIENLYGNRNLLLKLENELEMRLKSTLSLWGFETLKLTIKWNLGSYEKVMQATNDLNTSEELAEIETLAIEGDAERRGRKDVAEIHAINASVATKNDFVRNEHHKDIRSQLELERLQSEADMLEAKEAIALKEELKLAKVRGMRAELEVEQDMKDREHGRDMEYLKTITDAGGSDIAKVVSEGREYGKMSAAQLEALAKVRQSEMVAKDDKVRFMMEVEDRERADSYRRQELDASMMSAAQGNNSPSVRKCPGCESTIPNEASFCSQCGTKIQN
jgi:hypothetical protein